MLTYCPKSFHWKNHIFFLELCFHFFVYYFINTMMGDHYYDPDPHHPHSNLCQEWQLLCLAQCPIWRGKQLPSTITDPVIYLSINLSVSSVHHKRGRNEGGWRDLVWIEGIEWILRNAVRTYISLMCVCVCVYGWVVVLQMTYAGYTQHNVLLCTVCVFTAWQMDHY